ncbi:CocE/NonD family hydrolase C-terminal non-catalytic domain-containing protein, partial [[Ruminococcus] torques]
RDFTDYQWQTEIYQDWCAHPAHWKEALLSEKNRFSLSYQTAPLTDDYLLRGTPTVKLRAASDHDHGLLSVFLIDQGSAK